MKSTLLFLLLITLTVVHVAYGFNAAILKREAGKAEVYQQRVEFYCTLAFPNPGTSQDKCIQEKSVLMAMKPTGLR